MELFKKIGAVLISVLTILSTCMTVFASDRDEDAIYIEDAPIISCTEEWTSPTTKVSTTIRDLGDGFTVTDIETTTINPMRSGYGTQFKERSMSVSDGDKIVALVHVDATFSYNGKTATVEKSSSYHEAIDGYVFDQFSEKKGNSGFLHDAYFKAVYKVTQQKTGKSIESGKCEVTCSKDGN